MRRGMRFFVLPFLLASFIATGFFIFADCVRAETITVDTVWGADEVHVVPDGEILEVNPGVRLTLGAGAILKLGWNSVVRLHGSSSLIALGTAEKPAVITSLRDDSFGGDSNGDGPMSMARPGDWRLITTYSGVNRGAVNIDFDHVILKYGGGTYSTGTPILLDQGSDLRIVNSQLIDNKGAILLMTGAGNVSINNSDIYNRDFCWPQADNPDYCGMGDGIKNYSTKSFDFSGNYWGHSDGPSIAFPSLNYSKGTPIVEIRGGRGAYEPFKAEPIWAPAKRDPVILVPGILGSWYRPTTGKWELDPILNTYHDLWQALEAAGYVEGETLFAFPYQWRQSNVLTALELKEKIAEVKAITESDKVDLVTHSMGGLVARQYIETPGYDNDVDQLIFIATPHHGAPKAYLMWEGGEFGPELYDKVFKYIFSLEAIEHGYDDRDGLVRYFRDFGINPVKELLPDYDYLRNKETEELLGYPDGYPINEFLEIINDPALLDKLENVDVLNIVTDSGKGETLASIRIGSSTQTGLYPDLWQHGEPDGFYDWFSDHGLINGAGDDTVPLDSNNNFNGFRQESFFGSTHQSIVTKAQKAVVKELTGNEPESEFISSPVEKLLMFRIFSPADFQIVAPDGKRLGRNLSSDGVLEEIPGGYYSGFAGGQEEYAIIANPLAGEYRVSLLGTGEGSYSLVANYIDDSTSTESSVSSNIVVGQNESHDFIFDGAGGIAVDTIDSEDGSIGELGSCGSCGFLPTNDLPEDAVRDYNLIKQELKTMDEKISWLTDFTVWFELYPYLSTDQKILILAPLIDELIELRQQRDQKILIISGEKYE